MNIYSKLLYVCECLKHRERSRYKLIRGLNHFKYLALSRIENFVIRQVPTSLLALNKEHRNEIITASLTSYPGRINECYYAIVSIFLQTYKPDVIVLWLAEEQFPDRKIPSLYNRLIEKGLVVRFCEDLRSHKKYYYALQEQKKNELVITFDDDIIYNPKTIERVYNKHLQYPQSLIANEIYEIPMQTDGEIKPYTQWRHPSKKSLIPLKYKYSVLTGSGLLYPFDIMPKETFNVGRMKEIAFSADDLWITFMAIYNDVSVVPTDIMAKVYSTVINSQREHLGQINSIGTGNDDTVKRLFLYYPETKVKLLQKQDEGCTN